MIRAYGRGIEIVTFSNSRDSFSISYSMFTSHVPFPEGEGQQLTIKISQQSYFVILYMGPLTRQRN